MCKPNTVIEANREGEATRVLRADGTWGHFALVDAGLFKPAEARRRVLPLARAMPGWQIGWRVAPAPR